MKHSFKSPHKILYHLEKGEITARINRKDLLKKIVFEGGG